MCNGVCVCFHGDTVYSFPFAKKQNIVAVAISPPLYIMYLQTYTHTHTHTYMHSHTHTHTHA